MVIVSINVINNAILPQINLFTSVFLEDTLSCLSKK